MRVLILDRDERGLRRLERAFRRVSVGAELVEHIELGIRRLETEPFDALVTALRRGFGPNPFPELTVIRVARQRGLGVVVGHAETRDEELRRSCLSDGAHDCFVMADFGPRILAERVVSMINAAKKRPVSERAAAPGPDDPLARIIGHSVQVQQLRERILRAARVSDPLLVTGETGTGKELVAQVLHAVSGRAGRFQPFNAGSAPESLFESELCGHVKGAFTNAVQDAKGAIAEAGEGTLLIDEIGDLPLALQPRLLRILHELRYQRVGSVIEQPVRARIVCATNVDLEAKAKRGKFREDLLYRLNALHIEIPPLHERREDIVLIARAIATRRALAISDEALAWLSAQTFPGNVRELENVFKNVAAFGNGGTLADVKDAYASKSRTPSRNPSSRRRAGRVTPEVAIAHYEANGRNINATARALGVHRHVISRILKKRQR